MTTPLCILSRDQGRIFVHPFDRADAQLVQDQRHPEPGVIGRLFALRPRLAVRFARLAGITPEKHQDI